MAPRKFFLDGSDISDDERKSALAHGKDVKYEDKKSALKRIFNKSSTATAQSGIIKQEKAF